MRIGYACLAIGVPNTNLRACTIKRASNENLLNIITHNLDSLENLINYNIINNIKLFRISSDIIPFGSSPVNKIDWWNLYDNKLRAIGEKILKNNMRVSMHPGQYTVLNSPNEDVAERAIDDLNYHTLFLDSMGLGREHKIILHVGGMYKDKGQAMCSFIKKYKLLGKKAKSRIVLENDEKSYNIHDVLEIGYMLKIPVVFDNLHNKINPYDKNNDYFWIRECKSTWSEKDGLQKIHYSQQDISKKSGAHSNTININEFIDFSIGLEYKDIDIMLEVKDKNLSAIKCSNVISVEGKIKALEYEWSKYKYLVLEKSPSGYLKIRKLLNNKEKYPVTEFYNLIDSALANDATKGNAINAASHIWGYFKDIALHEEKERYFNCLDKYKQGKIKINTVKNFLWKMVEKYNREYLYNSYYFTL